MGIFCDFRGSLIALVLLSYASLGYTKNFTLSGSAYLRSDVHAYESNQITAPLISGASVNSNSMAVATNDLGNFRISSDIAQGVESVPLNAQANGFIDYWGKAYPVENEFINIGMYADQNVSQRPGFVSGVFVFDANGIGFQLQIHDQGLLNPTLNRLVSQVGANLVALSDTAFVDYYDVALPKVSIKKTTKSLSMLSREKYLDYVSSAHSRGMRFLLTLGVYPDVGGIILPYSVDHSNVAFWDAWFEAYKPIVREYSEIARDAGIDYLSLGMNAAYMSSLPVSYWRDLVSVVRGSGFKGKIAYQAMAMPDSGRIESDWFNGAGRAWRDADKLQRRVEFADLFDVIVIDVYNIVQNRTSPLSATREEMRKGFRWVLDKVKDLPTPIFIQIGTPSIYGGAVVGEYVEPCMDCGSLAPQKIRDFQQQADVYQAFGEVVNGTSVGSGNVMGLLSWGYWFTDNDFQWTSLEGKQYAMAFDKSGSIRGKPAESVMRWWTAKFTGNPLPILPDTSVLKPTPSPVIEAPTYPAPNANLKVTITKGNGSITSDPVGIACGSTCSYQFTKKMVIKLTATPANGAKFGGWSGACTGKKLTCSVKLTSNKSVKAKFN